MGERAWRCSRAKIKMKLRSTRLSALVAGIGCALGGCASVPQQGPAADAAEVRIYQSGQLSASQYEVVRHIWVDSWRTTYAMPAYPSEAEGIAALRTEAARLGADGLVNVICLDQGHSSWSWGGGSTVLCYGNAIRVRHNEG
jgi:uncharacterized protein YbjQ (UPF0145 family)